MTFNRGIASDPWPVGYGIYVAPLVLLPPRSLKAVVRSLPRDPPPPASLLLSPLF